MKHVTPSDWPFFTDEQIAEDFAKFLDSVHGHGAMFHINHGDDTATFCGIGEAAWPEGEHAINIAAAEKWPGLFEQVRICKDCIVASQKR